MKKIVSLSMCCFLLFSFWGCSQKTPQETLEQALEKTNQLSDSHLIADVNMTLSAQGITMPISINLDSSIKDTKSKNVQSKTDLKMFMLGMEVSGTVYTRDGYAYSNFLGEKSKTPLTNSEKESKDYTYFDSDLLNSLPSNQILNNFPSDKLNDLTMKKGGNGTQVLTATLDHSVLEDYFSNSLDDLMGDNADIKMDEVDVTATISKNGYLESIVFSSDIALDSSDTSNSNMKVELKVINPGKSVSIDFPEDLDSYPEVAK